MFNGEKERSTHTFLLVRTGTGSRAFYGGFRMFNGDKERSTHVFLLVGAGTNGV